MKKCLLIMLIFLSCSFVWVCKVNGEDIKKKAGCSACLLLRWEAIPKDPVCDAEPSAPFLTPSCFAVAFPSLIKYNEVGRSLLFVLSRGRRNDCLCG